MGGGHELQGKDLDFYATGLVGTSPAQSAPTVHANYRYFERGEGKNPEVGGLVEVQI